ncbi:hypothetical protein SDC9_210344 [bioreactor metagenome]|uniref:Uncharacterized protein n=1 Tax=bioreactor metagenome TaxID=1076179 RepID=A0A645JTG7_9ZZZZ
MIKRLVLRLDQAVSPARLFQNRRDRLHGPIHAFNREPRLLQPRGAYGWSAEALQRMHAAYGASGCPDPAEAAGRVRSADMNP